MAVNCVFCQVGVPERNTDLTKNIESPDILHNGHRYRHDPFLPEHRPAATGRIQFESQLGNIQAAAPMPLTSPGNDDGTGGKPSAHTAEKHCRTRPTNIEAIHFLFASLLRILHSTCAKRWNSAKILFAWYLLGWVAKRGCGTILRGGALWRRAFLANRGKETGP